MITNHENRDVLLQMRNWLLDTYCPIDHTRRQHAWWTSDKAKQAYELICELLTEQTKPSKH